jgi:hypothetical protein
MSDQLATDLEHTDADLQRAVDRYTVLTHETKTLLGAVKTMYNATPVRQRSSKTLNAIQQMAKERLELQAREIRHLRRTAINLFLQQQWERGWEARMHPDSVAPRFSFCRSASTGLSLPICIHHTKYDKKPRVEIGGILNIRTGSSYDSKVIRDLENYSDLTGVTGVSERDEVIRLIRDALSAIARYVL